MSAAQVTCPFCDGEEIELVSPWGGQLITSQLRCRSCNSHFEAVREDFGGPAIPSGEANARPVSDSASA